jgi:hypothetical protein
MQGTSFNIVDLTHRYLDSDVIGKMSSVLGEDSGKIQKGISGAVPGLLAALGNASSSSNGARRITAAVNSADDGILNNLTGTPGKSVSSEAGLESLRPILGFTARSSLIDNVERISGLSHKGASSLIGMLTPVVFGVLKRAMPAAGPDSCDVTGLLDSQKTNIAAAMPEDMFGGTSSPPRTSARTTSVAAYRAAKLAHTRGRRFAWVMPLAFLATALGLVWYWAGQPRDSAFAPPSTVQAGGAGTTLPAQTYTVRAGDTLQSISKMFYGNSDDYVHILNANRDRIAKNGDRLIVGQELTIPLK